MFVAMLKWSDCMEYMFTTGGLQLSVKCKERCRVKIIQLYERGANLSRIGLYWRNWVKWANVDFDIAAFKSELVRYFQLIHFFKPNMETYYDKPQIKTLLSPC